MQRNFKKDWILYNSWASAGTIVSAMYWPFTATLFVILIQIVMLKKFVGWRALLWVLNPFLVWCSWVVCDFDMLYSIVLSACALEFVFTISTGKFSWFIWSLIVGTPSIISGLLVFKFRVDNDFLLIVIAIAFPILIWIGEAYYLEHIFKNKIAPIPIKEDGLD